MAVERRRRPKHGKRKKKSPKQAASELAIEQRRERITKLRISGWSIRDIAAHIGCSIGTVHGDLSAVLERTQDAANDATKRERAVSLARLDVATKGIWPEVETGGVEAVDRLVKLEQRRARLLGLDAPARQEISGPGGGAVPIEARSALESKLDELRKRLTAGTAPESGAAEPSGTAGG